jgi:hypothetical protein
MISPLANGIISLLVMACLVAFLILSKDPEKRPLLWSLVVIWGLLCFFVAFVGGGPNS